MTKKERIKFVEDNKNTIDNNMFEKIIDFIKNENDNWDFDLIKQIFYNKEYHDSIVLVSITYLNQKHIILIIYYSFNAKTFCFSHKDISSNEYKRYLRDKIIQELIN